MKNMQSDGSVREKRARRYVWVAAMIASAMLSACDKKPGGQVVAVVNGVEITQQELRSETESLKATGGQNAQGTGAAVLKRIVERTLLADYAREEGMDRGPEFVARRRQIEEALLADLAVKKLMGAQPKPTAQELQAYIARNPTLFAQRQRLTLDQIRIATPADGAKIKALTGLGSTDAIARQLGAERVQFAHGPAVLDTAAIDPSVAKQIAALPNGEVFDVSTGGTTFISAITARASAATAPSTWLLPAQEAMARERAARTLQEALAKLRARAKIAYDPALKPQ